MKNNEKRKKTTHFYTVFPNAHKFHTWVEPAAKSMAMAQKYLGSERNLTVEIPTNFLWSS